MDPYFKLEQFRLRDHVRAWVNQHLLSRKKIVADVDQEAGDLLNDLGRAGFLSYTVPKKYAGVRPAVSAQDLCILREELARGSSLADTMFAVQALGSYPITLAGNDHQKLSYLPPMAKGEAIAAFALTEPQAGSDVAAIESRAVKRGEEYLLTGTKSLISNAGLAHTYVVFALTDPKRRKKGVSAFVVESDTPGVVVKERVSLMSPHPIGTVAFEDCLIPQGRLLGREGEGLKIALTTLDLLRCSVGAAALGLAQRAMEEAIDHSQTRRQFGKRLAEFQSIQFQLADMATELEASRLLVHHAAWTRDHSGEGFTQRSSMAKLFATEAAQRVIDQALQIHGGLGLVSGNPVEQLYRDVRALRIYEGTSEIQKLIIARNLLGKK